MANLIYYALITSYSEQSEKKKLQVLVILPDSLRPHGLLPARLPYPLNSPSKNTGVSSYSLLQGIFLTQGLNLGLLHCRQILSSLSYQGSPGAELMRGYESDRTCSSSSGLIKGKQTGASEEGEPSSGELGKEGLNLAKINVLI